MSWNDLSMADRATYIKLGVENGITDLNVIRGIYNKYANGGNMQPYQVKRGDSLWRIAHNNRLTLNELMSYNKQLKGNINTIIHPGDMINIAPTQPKFHYEYENIDDIEKRERNLNKDNLSAIQSVTHDGNYVVIDKKNRRLRVFDSSNKEIYSTNQINTGLSKNDYNTITYVDANGNIRDMQGNNSTPAGITIISGVGQYHGVPSFTRARINQEGKVRKINGKTDDIASSLHFGIIAEGKGSNGCVRVGGKQLQDLSKYIGVGTKIYTLPEKKGSRFEVRQGRLNYFADNPYGKTKGKEKFWDDYNTHSDKSYNPLIISSKKFNNDYKYEGNVVRYSAALMQGKKKLQKMFNLDSYTYDKLAQLAMGIAQQETKFNTSTRKMVKDITPDFILNVVRGDSNRSRGATQIKLNGDNNEMRAIYKKLNINEDNIEDIFNSGIATMARLAYMYNSEVKGRHFKGPENSPISPYDALLYKWMGHNEQLRNKTATPNDNIYIRNVKKYIRDFNFESGKMVYDE